MKSTRFSMALLVDFGLILLVILTRVFSASRFLHKWDSVQFALALSDYDIVRHQPHPPGYPGYIGLAWIIRRFVPDDNLALVIVGIISAIVLAIAVHHLGRVLIGLRGGFIAGLLAALNPLLWYFSSIALAYIAGVAVATVACWVAFAARGRVKWLVPALAGMASVIWPPAGILVFPVCLWAFLRERTGEHGGNAARRIRLGTIGFVALWLLLPIICYIPAIADTGLWTYFHELQSESGKHVLRFSQWIQSPLDEFVATTGSLAQFFEQGIGIGRWLLIMLVIPVTGEKGCDPRRVIGLLPLFAAGFVAMHWGSDSALRVAGILAFAVTVAYLLPKPETEEGWIRRRFLMWWLAPGMLLFVLVYVNYVGILIIFLPALIILEAWGIERAAKFMMLQTIRDRVKVERSEDSEGEEDLEEKKKPVRKEPDARVEKLVAWLLVGLMAMHEIGVFTDHTTESQESLRGIIARDSWIEEVVSAVESAPVPLEDLLILGGEDNYRHWTYYIPDATVVWTKYLLYRPYDTINGVWFSHDRIQSRSGPLQQAPVPDGSDDVSGVLWPIDGRVGLIVFPEELELFRGSAMVTPLGMEEEDLEPVCFLVDPGEAENIVFTVGEWWLE